VKAVKRVVVVTPLPTPDPVRDQHGVYRRLRVFLRALGRVAETVEVAHFADMESSTPRLSDDGYSDYWGVKLRVVRLPLNCEPRQWLAAASAPIDICARRDFRPFAGPLQKRALQALMANEPDLVFAHRLPAMWALRDIRIDAPIVFDLDDIEHRVKLRAARQAGATLGGALNLVEVPALLRAEHLAVARAAITFLCSTQDREYLIGRGMAARKLLVVPNAVDMPAFALPPTAAPTVLSLGHYGYEPNAAAARELINAVWPIVRAKRPEARLIVAGAASERVSPAGANLEGVEVTGVVADLEALYQRVRLVCCPIRVGGGTRIKLIEAAAFGRPIVATAVALEGLDFEDGRDCLIGETPSELAAACLNLIEDEVTACGLARAARKKVFHRHDLNIVRDSVAAALLDVVAGAAAPVERRMEGQR